MLNLLFAIIKLCINFILLIIISYITIFILIINFFIMLFNIITGQNIPYIKRKNHTKYYPKKTTIKNPKNNKTYEYDKKNNIWHLTKEDKRFAKEERMSYSDYIEAEERDDDDLDDDD